jgi:hypothetical protein
MFLLPAGTYFLSGCPSGGSSGTYAVQLITMDDALSTVSTIEDYGIGKEFTLTEDTLCRVNFVVKSGTKINGLNVYFQVEQGRSATPFEKGNAQGQVWIKPNYNSAISFEALKNKGKNIVILQPGEVYMFTESGGWKLQSGCKIYQGGVWKDLESSGAVYYFKDGDQYTGITGGWTTEGWTRDNFNQNQLAKINTSNMYVCGSQGAVSAVGTVNRVNISGINTIKASINHTGGTVTLCVCDGKNTSNSSALKANTTTGTCVVSLDVSGYSGSYYIILFAHGVGSEATVMDVWGE